MLLETSKRWHKHALEHSPLDNEIEVRWDEYWGCKMMKDRYAYASKTSGMTVDSMASEDLGLLHASVIVLFHTVLLPTKMA